jgi:hypothetical protein
MYALRVNKSQRREWSWFKRSHPLGVLEKMYLTKPMKNPPSPE